MKTLKFNFFYLLKKDKIFFLNDFIFPAILFFLSSSIGVLIRRILSKKKTTKTEITIKNFMTDLLLCVILSVIIYFSIDYKISYIEIGSVRLNVSIISFLIGLLGIPSLSKLFISNIKQI